MTSITLSQALVELNLLDKRIAKKKKAFQPCAVRKGAEFRSDSTSSESDFERKTVGAWQSLQALMDRRRKIQAAVHRANANATVHVGGIGYTIAEALDLKKARKIEQEIITDLRSQLANATAEVDRMRNANNDRLVDYLKEVHQKKENQLLEVDHAAISERFEEVHYVELADPLHLELALEAFEKEVGPFLKEVDTKISEANKVHTITVAPS